VDSYFQIAEGYLDGLPEFQSYLDAVREKIPTTNASNLGFSGSRTCTSSSNQLQVSAYTTEERAYGKNEDPIMLPEFLTSGLRKAQGCEERLEPSSGQVFS
jgi:hypothetical protein